MSDVTKRVVLFIAAASAVIAVVGVALGVTLLRPEAVEPTPRVPLSQRVPGAVLPVAAAAVLSGTDEQALTPTSAALAAVLEPLISASALGSGVSIDVLDPLTGEHLLSQDRTAARTPASTAKLLTAAAALTALGPETTLATTTVTGSKAGQVVLVGAGDVMLAAGAGDPDAVNGRAGLADLAEQTAAALEAEGTSKVRVILDDQFFTGPSRASGWSASDVDDGYVAPVQALEIDAGRVGAGHYAQRSSDPALAAAQTFAELLRGEGLTVTGSVRRGSAPQTASGEPMVLGEVESAPVSALVEYALTESDNTVAEALGRLVAESAGQDASFAEAGPAVLAELDELGLPVAGAVMTDTSGLGEGSAIPARTLSGVLALAAGDEQPQLRAVLSGLPVAAVSGTLVDRYTDSTEKAASGVVRAKTGTLTGVSSLAGTVVDQDGRLLVFAVMADEVKNTTKARNALDRVAATLAACGCR